jgi:hypothetical protein
MQTESGADLASLGGVNPLITVGHVPESIKIAVAPKRCSYTSPEGTFFEGTVTNVTPYLGDLNMYELVDRSWYAGVIMKITCVNLRQSTVPGHMCKAVDKSSHLSHQSPRLRHTHCL